MRIERIVLTIRRAALTRPFENRWQRFESWDKFLVEVVADGVSGFGECSAMPTPYYNYETVETAWWVTRSYLAPLLLGRETGPRDAAARWAHIHGYEEAKAALECALWDCEARLAGRPLYELLGGGAGPVRAGATIGIHPTPEGVAEAVGRAVREGFHRVRVKIRPGWDVAPLTAVRAAYPDVPLLADANAGYDEADADLLAGLDRFGLLGLEQPFAPERREATRKLQARMETAISLDEGIKTVHDAECALAQRACRIVNVKLGRVGGIANALRILALCREAGVDVFVGAKYDLGIGRWTNIAFASLPGITLPSDVGPSARYFANDPSFPAVNFSEPGSVVPLAAPGIGARLGPGETVSELVLDAAGDGARAAVEAVPVAGPAGA
ncbi:MAG: o-succinylbenzoate synthase [Candidatus Eremiobacteraeota bacterium]|jgi:O-succinylbenzoate synthase|nr:o-succinylbenzoate synthase [Candidatus Eremiobacteraeota bacterium]